jgi:curved DNA-binding protein
MSAQDLENLFGNRDPFSDFFYSVFGSGAGGTRTREQLVSSRGEDVQGETTISLEEAYAGTTRTIELATASGTRKVEVKIPPGIQDGARVRAAGQGASGRGGGRAGDLYIKVGIRRHPVFARDGDDLRVRVDVPLDIGLRGGEVEVPTLKGTRVHLKIPPETQNGTQLRLRGLGMPRLRGGGHGDLFAEVNVKLPLPLTPEMRAWTEQMPKKGGGG